MTYLKRVARFFFITISFLAVANFVVPGKIAYAAICNTKSECDQMLQANQKAVSSKKIQIDSVQSALDSLNAQIGVIQDGINIRTQQIDLTTNQIDQTQAQIDQKTKDLIVQKANLNETVVAYYENSNQSTLETVVGSNSLSDAIDKAQYMEAIGANLNNAITKINQTMADLKTQSQNLTNDKNDLENQRGSLASQKSNLANQQKTQQNLLNNVQGSLVSLQSQQAAIQAAIQAQLSIRGRSSWGTDLIQDSLKSWHQTQIGDYTTLGDTPYTVNDFGCYIASLAMAATYYGHPTSVDSIANNPNNFDGEGNFRGSVSGISINSMGLDFAAAKQYVDNKGLVIAKMVFGRGYHFVVINGTTSDGKYLIQDPLAPAYRESYGVGQVVDLRKISPN